MSDKKDKDMVKLVLELVAAFGISTMLANTYNHYLLENGLLTHLAKGSAVLLAHGAKALVKAIARAYVR